jgi:hypothetical protein
MEFKQSQQQFMDYIRDPNNPLPEGIEPRRMTIYRELFFNNINGFVSSAFPVLKSVYTEQDWLALVQTFFAQHDCQTPIFVEIAGEFLAFLQQEYQVKDSDPAFLLELAHYEWLELIVSTVQSSKNQTSIKVDEISQAQLQLSTSAKVAQYQFDVQHISTEYQPIEPPSTPQFFCVYRDTQEEVSFLQLNPLTAQVLALVDQYTQQQQSLVLDDIVNWLAELYPNMQTDALIHGCVQMLTQMVEKNIILKPST